MTKRILVISLFLYATIFAQENPIVASGGYSKIYKGKEVSFEKAVSSHVGKWHGADQWPTFAAIVMSGPRSGQYFMGTSNHYQEQIMLIVKVLKLIMMNGKRL